MLAHYSGINVFVPVLSLTTQQQINCQLIYYQIGLAPIEICETEAYSLPGPDDTTMRPQWSISMS